ncbi:3-phosphoserine/phosphohydroxythreonine transaminase [Larsenimonas rhizosphaerae]|uniref:3-phosphoserine/phosphohydroxythreonine transaminase n=1 Tax=Larsenimonas rhizosphaerae TaxID=2944682 RepID=UPI0020347C42|nr:3-phosphoserine/phosphohydroxythreonine transaminase [Larsenimonas rhizosphaerae]MCM2131009.1 3-phosphoserine/phosphohydroxythreonine transaminase [Larsenimonas rhizosphaerae]
MTRHYNFCSGPATLPLAVLERAQSEMLDYRGKGLSVMEMSHRSSDYMAIAEKAEADFRDLLGVPDNYSVLFMQGGAATQFSASALNLTGRGGTPNFLDTGIWSRKAMAEAERLTGAHLAGGSKSNGYTATPASDSIQLSDDAAYLHFTDNETIGGVQFDRLPEVNVPLVCDMSSSILSVPLDISRYGVIYAGAQKNIGPAGLTLVIVRNDLLEQAQDSIPSMLSWKVMAENGSMYNTPPTYAWYLAGLVFEWLKEQGGVEAMAVVNRRKAEKVYRAIDGSRLYDNPIAVGSRSIMNIPFTLKDEALNDPFLRESEAAGLLTLKGHRSVGGMRASIYNAMPEEGVDALVDFMAAFEQRHWKG